MDCLCVYVRGGYLQLSGPGPDAVWGMDWYHECHTVAIAQGDRVPV